MTAEVEIPSEQQHETAVEPPGEHLSQRPPPRGRPWVKGQSGNPAGRPPRAHPTGAVAEYLIGRKTIPLTKKLISMALAGDRMAMRLCLERVAPPRRDASDWLGQALVEDRAELRTLMDFVADATEKGAVTQAQGEALVRLARMFLQMG
jgi:hypothetical protein